MRFFTRTVFVGVLLAALAAGCGPATSSAPTGGPSDPNAPNANPGQRGVDKEGGKKGLPSPPPIPPPK